MYELKINDPDRVQSRDVQSESAANNKGPDAPVSFQLIEGPVENNSAKDKHGNAEHKVAPENASSTLEMNRAEELVKPAENVSPEKVKPRRKSLRKNAAMSYEYFFSQYRIRKSKDKKKCTAKSPVLKENRSQAVASLGKKSKNFKQPKPQEKGNLSKGKKSVIRKSKDAGKAKLSTHKVASEASGKIGSEIVIINQMGQATKGIIEVSPSDLSGGQNPGISSTSVKQKRSYSKRSIGRSASSSPDTSCEEITEIGGIPPLKKSKQFLQSRGSASLSSDTDSVIPLETSSDGTHTGYSMQVNRAPSIIACDAWSSAESTVFTPATRFLTPGKNVATTSVPSRSKTSPLTIQCPITPTMPRPVVLPPLTPPSIGRTSHTSASPMYGSNQPTEVISIDVPMRQYNAVQLGSEVQQGCLTQRQNLLEQHLSSVRPPSPIFPSASPSSTRRARRTSTPISITDNLIVNTEAGPSTPLSLPTLERSPGGGRIIGVKTITEVIDVAAEEDQGRIKQEKWRRIHPMSWSVSK